MSFQSSPVPRGRRRRVLSLRLPRHNTRPIHRSRPARRPGRALDTHQTKPSPPLDDGMARRGDGLAGCCPTPPPFPVDPALFPEPRMIPRLGISSCRPRSVRAAFHLTPPPARRAFRGKAWVPRAVCSRDPLLRDTAGKRPGLGRTRSLLTGERLCAMGSVAGPTEIIQEGVPMGPSPAFVVCAGRTRAPPPPPRASKRDKSQEGSSFLSLTFAEAGERGWPQKGEGLLEPRPIGRTSLAPLRVSGERRGRKGPGRIFREK